MPAVLRIVGHNSQNIMWVCILWNASVCSVYWYFWHTTFDIVCFGVCWSFAVLQNCTTVSDDGAADRSWSRQSALTAVETSDGVFVHQRVVISGCRIQTICHVSRVSSSETQGLTKTAISAEQRCFLSVDFLHTCTWTTSWSLYLYCVLLRGTGTILTGRIH